MKIIAGALLAAMTVFAAAAWSQSAQREPHIGYLYPAGGRQGSVFHVMAGGQFLNGVSSVDVTGEGVRAAIVRNMGRARRLNGGERRELGRRLEELRAKLQVDQPREGRQGRRAERPAAERPATKRPAAERPKEGADGPQAGKKKDAQAAEPVKLPNHPLLNALDELSLEELEFVENEYLRADNRKQPNTQIAETVLIEVTVDPGAAPGGRELRLVTSSGLTNPMCFEVGELPEISEPDPYDPRGAAAEPVDLPVLLNGQIRPGDVDRFRFRAQQGQRLVIETHARRLVPFLADAVPGWFQVVLTLFDAAGDEAAFADDYLFSPDPVLLFEVPQTGVYELEVRDSIYRGREDFVYRISIGERPFITSMFPLGGREDGETIAAIDGWNLPEHQLLLDTTPGGARARRAALHSEGAVSNCVTYAVDTLPECVEAEPNNTPRDAQPVDLPHVVNGRIAAPGDEDFFRFRGRGGDEIVAEVSARRLLSPLDSLLRLTDESGNVVAWNDDCEHKDGFLHRDMGTLTHHADSYLRARLPRKGTYTVQLADTRGHGGEAFAYRLRIGPPRPDFALLVTPSSVTARPGLAVPLCVHVLRRDGFDGDIEMMLKDAPPGFELHGGVIPGGRDRIRMTLTAPRKPLDRPVSLRLEGRAAIGRKTVSRPAVPAEEVMQAFLYRHLVPSQELAVMVAGPGSRMPPPVPTGDTPVRIPAGGTAKVRLTVPRRAVLENLQLELSEPPEGLTLHDVIVSPGGLALVLKADKKAATIGFAGNLIVEVYTEREGKRRGDKAPKQKQRILLGALPAIPFEIVRR